jgi:helicase
LKSKYKIFLTNVPKKDLTLQLVSLPINKKYNGIQAQNEVFVEFHKESGRLRPIRFWKIQRNKEKYFKPREFIDILNNSQLIYINDDFASLFKEDFLSMLQDFQIDTKKVIKCKTCPFCLIHGLITIDKDSDISYLIHDKEQKICYRCAKLELLDEFYQRGAVLNNKMKKAIFRTLQKNKNIDHLIKLFTDEIDPAKHPELTLFDEILYDTEATSTPTIDDLSIPDSFKKIIKARGILKLLPIQKQAVDEGLLNNQDLLVVSATTTGKTLIGELAGVSKSIMNKNKKTVFLVPLVALANQKYTEFQEKYSSIGLKTAIRVGMSRIDTEEELVIVDSKVTDANIIVGTYEAFDFLLRSGKRNEIGDIGTLIIDEIQLLADPERGVELDGLISRMRSLFPETQLLFLSATVGNPQVLAEKLKVKLLTYKKRPVPLERHLVLAKDENRKLSILAKLIRREYKQKSSFGYKGQSIIFTFSRRRCKELAKNLQGRGINAVPYHAGLTYPQRKRVETGFLMGQYSAVITTAALAAGVDFPASQVIFEALAMGINWLTVAEFEQMSGRAGRMNYHDRGKVVLLIEPGLRYNFKQKQTEDAIAIKLLEGKIEEVSVTADSNQSAEQLLASISSFGDIFVNELEAHYNSLLASSDEFDELLRTLGDTDLISIDNEYIKATPFGTAVSESFLSPEIAVLVKKQILEATADPLNIAIKLEPFEQVYHSNKLQAELNRIYSQED